jgi:acyl-CoA synthetase (AMP-forming)/AMP-acid ligase II
MLTHRNLVANMLQAKAWMIPTGVGQDTEIVISALPL